jgi:hypothetical protein
MDAAELNIAQFSPPASGADPPPNPPNADFRVNIQDVKTQYAQKSSLERTEAIFNFLENIIPQGVNDEISRQQIVQRISTLEQRIAALEALVARNNLV